MKLKVDFELKHLDGSPVPNTAASYLSEMLIAHQGDALKLYELALNISKSSEIEIDTADLQLVEAAIKANTHFNNLIKGGLLKEIERQKVTAASG